MASIIKVYKETAPALMLVGKAYYEEDRDAYGTYSGKWKEWFAKGWFSSLGAQGRPCFGGGYVGAMRMNEGVFEYWIGMLMEENTAIPAGFSGVAVSGGAYATAWIQGKDEPALYEMHDACMAAFTQKGWKIAKDAWYIERYSCPRFTQPDENGEVILDYVVSLEA